MCRNALCWVPIFFLYFSSLLDVDEVLALEGIYYLSVVVLEVPSGYFSDRLGRRLTLIVGNIAGVASFVLFVMGSTFWVLAVAQLLLATWMAFNSGTDTSLLYDSLLSLGRSAEFGDRESHAASRAFFVYAVAALIGGISGSIDLRIPYALSGVGAIAATVVAMRFHEPEVGEPAASVLAQMKTVGTRITQPLLSWLFAFAVAMTVFAHVPYMLFQPYIEMTVVGLDFGAYPSTPLIAGALVCGMMLASSFASARAMRVARRFGTMPTLMALMLVLGALITAMGIWLHPLIIVLLLLRSVPSSMMKPPMNAAIHDRIDSGERATYFSVQSLAGRLAFSLSLFIGSATVGDISELTPAALTTLCGGYAIALLTVVVALLSSAKRAAS